MASRDLVTPVYDQAGIRYRASETAIPFLDSLGSQYIGQLRNASESVANKFSSFSDDELTSWVNANMGNWGTEFGFYTMFRPEGDDNWEL